MCPYLLWLPLPQYHVKNNAALFFERVGKGKRNQLSGTDCAKRITTVLYQLPVEHYQ